MADWQARRGREGSRWWNERPTGKEVAEWFRNEVPLHEGMTHDRYVSGITLIQTGEKHEAIIGYSEDGLPKTAEVREICWTPYPRVDVRIGYFWDLVATRGWRAEIAEVPVPATDVTGLPAGFFKLAIGDRNGNPSAFIGCSKRVRIWDEHGLREYPIGTKVVPVLARFGPDENALMKAETGAVGRALGMAGMLVVPGAGVATAEDMHEFQLGGGAPAPSPPPPQLPTEPTTEELRERMSDLIVDLQKTDQQEAMQDWWRQRGYAGIGQLDHAQVKAAVKQAERLLDRAKTPEGQRAAD